MTALIRFPPTMADRTAVLPPDGACGRGEASPSRLPCPTGLFPGGITGRSGSHPAMPDQTGGLGPRTGLAALGAGEPDDYYSALFA